MDRKLEAYATQLREEVMKPQSMDEALKLFEPVMVARNVALRSRKYFVTWVNRFNAFRTQVLRRSFQTCADADVVAFLSDQKKRYSSQPWQLEQAQEAVVMFLRNVIGLENIDTRAVTTLFRGVDQASATTDQVVGELIRNVPAPVDESRPEWYQQVQRAMRAQHYALRTESAYLDWLDLKPVWLNLAKL